MKTNKITVQTGEKSSFFSKYSKKIAGIISGLSTSLIVATTVYADESYLEPINKLKTVAISIVAAAGVIVLIYGGVKFAESFQKKDQNGEYNAIYTIVAGSIMVGISAIVGALT